jgi:hypothetical protein
MQKGSKKEFKPILINVQSNMDGYHWRAVFDGPPLIEISGHSDASRQPKG